MPVNSITQHFDGHLGYLEDLILHERANVALREFGITPQGWPKFRVIWSTCRRRWIAGALRPAYRGKEQWILEEWRPASCYGSKESWEAQKTDQGESRLGPYPAWGDYESIYELGEILDPSEQQVQFLGMVARQNAQMSEQERERMYQQDQERRSKEVERIMGDIVHDSIPSQRELDDYYTNDFRFEKQRRQLERMGGIGPTNTIYVPNAAQTNLILNAHRRN